MSDLLHLDFLWHPRPIDAYKIHFARKNKDGYQPLDSIAADFDGEWRSWQEWRGQRNDFNREFIFALAQDYRQSDRWLFGGIWRVTERLDDRYEVELSEELLPLIKRLWLKIDHRDRATRCKMESYFDNFVVDQISHQPYAARPFPGLQSLTVDFSELEGIVYHNVLEWREPLSAINGIYLLRVESTNSNYVGAAYGSGGVWSRWAEYVSSGHGGNALTIRAFGAAPINFARKNVSLTLLEPILPTISNSDVIGRERHWMNAIGSRSLENLNS
ncbi:MAG: hypothetical protein V2J51_06745 [Erythrobacter sp.]|jgi:hypothetical protein|nr:hypothetical protein [Erythrobacter sp.]